MYLWRCLLTSEREDGSSYLKVVYCENYSNRIFLFFFFFFLDILARDSYLLMLCCTIGEALAFRSIFIFFTRITQPYHKMVEFSKIDFFSRKCWPHCWHLRGWFPLRRTSFIFTITKMCHRQYMGPQGLAWSCGPVYTSNNIHVIINNRCILDSCSSLDPNTVKRKRSKRSCYHRRAGIRTLL